MDVKHASLESGEGEVVILPGLLCDSRMFAAQIAAFRATVIDQFYGQARSVEAMAAYALERLPPRAVLLGHSMSGRVALDICRQAPERVAGLIPADTGIHGVRAGEPDLRHALRDVGRRSGMAALVDEWLPPMLGGAARLNPGLYAMLHLMAVDAGLHTYEAQIEALLARPDSNVVLETLSCPVLVLVGREDLWSPVPQHLDIASRLSRAELRIIEQAGHFAPIEQPESVNQAICEWLTGQALSSDQQPQKGHAIG